MDEITKPKHYTQGKVEYLDAIDWMLEESTRIVKYMWRLRDKGDSLRDAKKAQFYLDRLIQKLEQ